MRTLARLKVIALCARRLTLMAACLCVGVFATVLVVAQGRPADPVSSFISFGQSSAKRYFASPDARFNRGVVPWGNIRFTHQGQNINPTDVRLYVEDGKPGIRFKGRFYSIPQYDLPILPLARFVERGDYPAYTIAADIDIPADYLNRTSLERTTPWDGHPAFIAKEFLGTQYEAILQAIDVDTKVERLPLEIETELIKELYGSGRAPQGIGFGSYVNADFNVTYTAELTDEGDFGRINFTGRPLRYYMHLAEGGVAVWAIEVFSQPSSESERDLQQQAISFFQVAALLRAALEQDPKDYILFVGVLDGSRKYGFFHEDKRWVWGIGGVPVVLVLLAYVARSRRKSIPST